MHRPAPRFDIQQTMQRALAGHRRGDLPFAAEQYRKVLHAMPQHADATHFLGLLEHQQGHTQAALVLLQHAIELNPVNVLYRHNLAGVYRELGQYPEAVLCYQRALAIHSGYVDSWIGLATVLLAQGEYPLALENCDHALALSPGNLAALEKKGEALHALGRDRDAIEIYHQLLQSPVKDPKILHVIGMALHAAGANADAIHCLRAAIDLSPGAYEMHNSLGIVLGDDGDRAGAAASYRNALRINPGATGAIHNLVNLVQLRPDDPLWPALMELAKRAPTLPPDEAIPLYFALGSLHEQTGDYAQAFEYFLEGNRRKRARIDYDEDRQSRFYRLCGQTLTPGSALEGVQSPSEHTSAFTPVFIVGFSRSGTTLVEQILASHPRVYGAGEVQQLWCAVRAELHIGASHDDDVPMLLADASAGSRQRIAGRYRAALTTMAPAATCITDKLSGNAPLIGLIHAAFPGARIIHCRRDPLDTCVSCFSKLFTSGHLFSYDLGELGRFYRLYESLMQHWQQSLPGGCILEVRYEDVVADVEGQARRLLRFCNLDWDANCLRFYETRRPVRTASLTQVHRPIYASSIGRWRHYESHLGPLQQALSG